MSSIAPEVQQGQAEKRSQAPFSTAAGGQVVPLKDATRLMAMLSGVTPAQQATVQEGKLSPVRSPKKTGTEGSGRIQGLKNSEPMTLPYNGTACDTFTFS